MAVQGCPFSIPADPASLRGPPLVRPADAAEWGRSNLSGLTHSHRYHFAPTNYSADGWYAAMYASQFRRDCRRVLLVDDDMNNSGIGFTAKIWSFALLLAMRDHRVLLEVQRTNGHSRWCDREPYSFQCLYEPWSHCPEPPPDIPAIVPSGRPLRLSTWPHRAPVVRTSLGRLHRQGAIWYGSKKSPVSAATRFLFRPRAWIRKIGECIMGRAGLKPSDFVSIHLRHSVEKSAEGKKLNALLPHFEAYHTLASALALDAGTRQIFLQTASPSGLADFSAFAHAQNLGLVYTDNPRSEHDSWGGWSPGSEMLQAVVGAVNAYISSHATVVASPGLSIWTEFLYRSSLHNKTGGMLMVRCPPSNAQTSWFGVFGPRSTRPLPSLAQSCRVTHLEPVSNM